MKGSILSLGKGAFVACASSSGCLRSAVGAGILNVSSWPIHKNNSYFWNQEREWKVVACREKKS